MPNGATSGVSDSIQPSIPNFEAAYALQNSWPTMPAVDEIDTTRPERWARMTGSTARVTFTGPNRVVSKDEPGARKTSGVSGATICAPHLKARSLDRLRRKERSQASGTMVPTSRFEKEMMYGLSGRTASRGCGRGRGRAHRIRSRGRGGYVRGPER